MNVPAAYLPEAEDDIEAAYAYCEQQLCGLGDLFVEELGQTIDSICGNPQLYGIVRRDVRASPLPRFGYVVYSRDRGSDILIIPVQHGSRSSRAWRRLA